MKYEAHVPVEQYGFISVELEGSAQDAVQAYEEVKQALNQDAGPGLPHRDWCRFLDVYVSTGSPPEDGMSLWQDMDAIQKNVVNELKKCIKRLNK